MTEPDASIPTSEMEAPGVYCRTKNGAEYQITSNSDRSRFTLWHRTQAGWIRLEKGKSPHDLYEKIPWLG